MVKGNHLNLNPYPLKLYGPASGSNQILVKEVAKFLKVNLAKTSYKVFSDGSFIVHHADSVRDRDVYIMIQPRFGNKENLSLDLDEIESLIFALRQGDPARITVVMPCLPYSRQDKASNHREPILVQKVPMRLQMAGAHRLVTLHLHNPSSYNAHPLAMPMVDVDVSDLLVKHIKAKKFDLKKFKIVAPDLGAAPAARKLAQRLGIPENIVIVNKFRDPKKSNHSEVMELIGDIKGFHAIMPDDMADTCGTAIKCLHTLKENGAGDVYFTATHAILSGNAIDNLNKAPFKKVWFSDSCLSEEARNNVKNLEIIRTAKLVAKIIDNLHNGKSVTELWHNGK